MISKNRKEAIAKVDLNKSFNLLDASSLVKDNASAKFDESVDLAIEEHGVVTIFETVEQPSIWAQLLVGAFPILLLLGIFFFFMRQMQGGMSGKGGPMSFGKSKAKLMEGGKVTTTFEDVAGCEEAKQDVRAGTYTHRTRPKIASG